MLKPYYTYAAANAIDTGVKEVMQLRDKMDGRPVFATSSASYMVIVALWKIKYKC